MAIRIEPDDGWKMPIPKGGHSSRRERKTSAAPKRDRGRQRDEAHLALVRQLPCISTGRMDRVEAAHLRFSEHEFGKVGPGHSAKPSDEWVLPLTHDEHMRQHDMREEDFWAARGIEPLKIAQQLYGISKGMRKANASEEDIIRYMTNIIRDARGTLDVEG